ncbi:MAG: hypothetical protein AM1032_000013 [Mycoplasmataceae bacterium]|nr:MAG: hypothetical protein AM1032_000013 [Mycoplasmataceae bacterium]
MENKKNCAIQSDKFNCYSFDDNYGFDLGMLFTITNTLKLINEKFNVELIQLLEVAQAGDLDHSKGDAFIRINFAKKKVSNVKDVKEFLLSLYHYNKSSSEFIRLVKEVKQLEENK